MTDVLPVCHGSPAGPAFDLALLMVIYVFLSCYLLHGEYSRPVS
jgi:hypothetical protein